MMKKAVSFIFSLSLLIALIPAQNKNLNYPTEIKKIDEVVISDTVYDIVTFGKFPQYKNNETGTYSDEPIRWRVAKKIKGKALLICENELYANVPFFEHFSDDRIVGGKTIYPNNYEYSEIRAYLNGLSFPDLIDENHKWEGKGFLQSAFTEEEQRLILITKVDNQILGNKYACRNTKDKIFLLSKKDVFNPDLGFICDTDRIRPATEYAAANMAFRSGKSPNGGIWWLRTPVAEYASRASVVLYTGEAEGKTNRTRDPITGIVPALWVLLK